jgi:hypothetical protein
LLLATPSSTPRRLTFIVGVTSPLSIVNSEGITAKRLIRSNGSRVAFHRIDRLLKQRDHIGAFCARYRDDAIAATVAQDGAAWNRSAVWNGRSASLLTGRFIKSLSR